MAFMQSNGLSERCLTHGDRRQEVCLTLKRHRYVQHTRQRTHVVSEGHYSTTMQNSQMSAELLSHTQRRLSTIWRHFRHRGTQ